MYNEETSNCRRKHPSVIKSNWEDLKKIRKSRMYTLEETRSLCVFKRKNSFRGFTADVQSGNRQEEVILQ